jgi:hypothetical protein
VCKILHVEICRDDEGRARVMAVLRRPDGSLVAVGYGGQRVELRRGRAPLVERWFELGREPLGALVS